MAMMNNDLSVIAEDDDGSFKDSIMEQNNRKTSQLSSHNKKDFKSKPEQTTSLFRTNTEDNNAMTQLLKQMAQFSEYAASSQNQKDLPILNNIGTERNIQTPDNYQYKSEYESHLQRTDTQKTNTEQLSSAQEPTKAKDM